MKLSPLTLIATLATTTMTSAWMMDRSPFSTYGIMGPVSPMRILREQQALANRIAKELSCPSPTRSMRVKAPRYELKDDHDKFALSVDLPGISSKDMTISYEDDRRLLSITGHREYSHEQGSYAERFSQSFYLDPTVDAEKISASLENGVLIVNAPKDYKKIENKIRTIPIAIPSKSTTDNIAVEGTSKPLESQLGKSENDAIKVGRNVKVKGVSASSKGEDDAVKGGSNAKGFSAIDKGGDVKVSFEEDGELFDLDSNEDF
jgi:HSP20 family molecular chaperone IbpA